MGRIDPNIRRVWLTGYGSESSPPDPIKPFTPTEQASNINWAEYLAWKNPQIKTFPQFLLSDMGKVSAADAARGKREYGDWQSGLYFNDGTPKPAATSFPLALHVDCTTDLDKKRGKLLVIWGHVRPGGGSGAAGTPSAADAGSSGPAAAAPQVADGRLGAAVLARPGETKVTGRVRRITGRSVLPPSTKHALGAEANCADADVQPTANNLSHVSEVIFCL